MVIVFVIDSFLEETNGTTITAVRTRNKLIELGHEVRVVTVGPKDLDRKDIYTVPERYIPIVTHYSRKQNHPFAKPVKSTLEKAFEGADVVHFFVPFKMSKVGLKIAKKMNIPVTSAYHAQPGNITYGGMNLGKYGRPLEILIYKWNKRFYKKTDNIHCPSKYIADEAVRFGVNSRMHVISNGVSKSFVPMEVKRDDDKINILMIGRFAQEKRQDLIVNAVYHSKYRDKIQIYFAGKGPQLEKIKRLGRKLPNEPIIGFYTEKELVELINKMDLYIHAADLETEGIAALEAIACGIVPIISDNKYSATNQFAIDDRSLFKAGKPKDLAKKIDYFIEHPEEKEELSKKYLELIKLYDLDYVGKRLEDMFIQAIREHQLLELEGPQKKYKKQFKPNYFVKFLRKAFFYLFVAPIIYLYIKITLNTKYIDRYKARPIKKSKRGGIVVVNHVHNLDTPMSAHVTWPKKEIYTTLPENLTNRKYGFLVKLLDGVPIPTTVSETKIFFYILAKEMRKGKLIHFYPEGHLIKECDHLRPFKNGAFTLAADNDSPILPIVIKSVKKEKGFRKRKTLVITGDPIYPNANLRKRDLARQLKEEAFNQMNEMLNKDYD